jgi:hypothetical protein
MTLILRLANEQQVALISDRRLTANGKVVEDEFNKAITLNLDDARVAVAFTGLARAGTFDTRRWLLTALLESATPEHAMEPTIRRFCRRASQDFAQLVMSNKTHKRLTVVLAGYCYNEAPPRCYYWSVSNFEGFDSAGPLSEARDEFRVEWYRNKNRSEEPYSLIATAGVATRMSDDHTESLRAILQEKKPASAIVGEGVEVLRAMARSRESNNLVGEQCTSIILPSSPDAEGVWSYHSSRVSRKGHAPSLIEARSGRMNFMIDSPEFEVRDDTGRSLPVTLPKVGRNQPCPCGSGKKYKRCCGASKREPMSVRFGGR